MTRQPKWIVTGGVGFIGTNVAHGLVEQGIHPVLVDSLARPTSAINLEWLRGELRDAFTFLHADVRDREEMELIFREHSDTAAVLHLAGQVAVTTSIADPRDDFDVNLHGSFTVLEAVRRNAPHAVFLNASTNKVYGALEDHDIAERETRYENLDYPDGVPESHALDPHSPYGCSKASAELYAIDFARIYGLQTFSFRQSCIYGPHQFGIEDQGWAAWFAFAAALEHPLTLFGTGKQVRDLLHVDDLLDLYLRAVDRPEAAGAYNAGGGPANTISLLELVSRLEERHARPVELSFAAPRPGDQRVFVCDVSRAEKRLGWRPTIDLDTGLEQLFEWVERHRDAGARVRGRA